MLSTKWIFQAVPFCLGQMVPTKCLKLIVLERGYTTRKCMIVGQIHTGHLTTISVKSAKVAIKIVIISNYQNLCCTFTQMLNEKI